MSIASVCKGKKKKKKNQSPFSRTRKSCRSASCLLGVSFPTLKKKKKKIERKRKKKKKKREGEKKKERKRKGKRKKKKKPARTAQSPLRPTQSDTAPGSSCALTHVPPFQPVGGARRAPQGAASAAQKAAVSPPRKKRLLQPLPPAKLRFPLLAISESRAVFVAQLLPLPLNPGSSNVGGGWFLTLPSIHPTQEHESPFAALLAKFQGKPHCETKHGRPWEGPEDAGRKGEKGGKPGRRTELAGENGEKCVPDAFKSVNTLKPNGSETCFRNWPFT